MAKSEYGKQEKVYTVINKFDPGSIPDPNTLNRQLRRGLQQVCINAVGLRALSRCSPSTVEEQEAVEIFSKIIDNFVSSHNIQISAVELVCHNFLKLQSNLY